LTLLLLTLLSVLLTLLLLLLRLSDTRPSSVQQSRAEQSRCSCTSSFCYACLTALFRAIAVQLKSFLAGLLLQQLEQTAPFAPVAAASSICATTTSRRRCWCLGGSGEVLLQRSRCPLLLQRMP
jgi:hypothetical protein